MSEYEHTGKQNKIQRTQDRRALIWRMEEEENERQVLQGKRAVEISDPDNAYEHHADAVAKEVVAGNSAAELVNHPPASPTILQQNNTSGIMPKSENGALSIADTLQTDLNNMKGGGTILDQDAQSEMSKKMGVDLGDVKIHTDQKAHEMNEAVNAKAFTYGQDIYFKQGNFNTSSVEGKELLAHELTHTVQQKSGLQRKIQRKALSPQQFADNYFSGIAGYSWKDLQTFLSIDGSGQQAKKLEQLLSNLISLNAQLTPAELWEQISIDPAQLKGYTAFLMYTSDADTLPVFNRATSTLTKEEDADAGMESLVSGTIDYKARRHFIFGKKKKETKRKIASENATLFLQQTAMHIDSVVINLNSSKHQLESNLQTAINEINAKIIKDAADKESQTFRQILVIKENAQSAKADILKYYYGSVTVIDENTEKQKIKLKAYANGTQEKLNKLLGSQTTEINKIYDEFNINIQEIADIKSNQAIAMGGIRYNKIALNGTLMNPLLKQGKQKAVVDESRQASNEIQNLAQKTKAATPNADESLMGANVNSWDQYEANQDKETAQININQQLEAAIDLLGQKAKDDKLAAKELRDAAMYKLISLL